jgi:hypothetical protein
MMLSCCEPPKTGWSENERNILRLMGTVFWNEVKQQVGEAINAAWQELGGEEWRLCQERGEGLEMDELCRRYTEGEVLGEYASILK